jgi:restriction system protein
MARKKSSAAEDIMDLVAMMPWWLGVALALVSYVVLHSLAAPPKVAAVQPNQISGLIVHSFTAGLAMIGQFIVPILCLVGALGSFLKRKQRQALFATAVHANSVESLNAMSWQEFEWLVGEAFRLQGYDVTEQGGANADGGVDLVLRKGTETHLVQCKQWKALKVGVDVVRELYGVMAATGAARGFVVTSGTFTPDAIAFATGRNVTLVDGPKLRGLIQQASASRAASKPTAARPVPDQGPPLCPACQSPMVRRTAKKGANAGSQFWGCSQYPSCRGTR